MPDKMEKIVSLCKRRGFIFPSSEEYGGAAASYDYGPFGVQLKNNIKEMWWRDIVHLRDNVVGLDAAILMNPKVWEASGHLQSFTDPLVECKECHKRFRADHLISAYKKSSKLDEHGVFTKKELKDMEKDIAKIKCPECSGSLTEPKEFNLMLKTLFGPVVETAREVYLRPETAQAIFVDFKRICQTMRLKLPFGIAQIGKSFRNEITPGDFTFRTCEFEQMELEWFCRPKEAEKWYKYWLNERLEWYKNYGIRPNNLRLRGHAKHELAHYAAACSDIEYNFPFGWSELEGIANRKDFDLKQHEKYSGKDLKYFDEEKAKKYWPYVIEPSGGVDRAALAFLADAYHEEKNRVVLKLDSKLAPYKVAVFPLLANKPKLVKKAREVFEMLKPHFMTAWDERGNIGKRYYAQDEIGTPLAITIDFQTLKDDTVTIRNRDSMKQGRIKTEELIKVLKERLGE